DHENSSFSVSGRQTVYTDPCVCKAVVNGIDPTFGDNCAGSAVAYALTGATTGSGAGSASGQTFNKGVSTVTYTVSDASTPANTRSEERPVREEGHENPTIAGIAKKTGNTYP